MLRCPHCLEEIPVEEPIAGTIQRCPVCTRALDPAVQEDLGPLDYAVHAPQVIPGQSREVQKYVQGLEKRALEERRRKPYYRPRPKVNLIAALVLIGCGFLLLGINFGTGFHMLAFLINGIFPAFACFMGAAICLFYWSR